VNRSLQVGLMAAVGAAVVGIAVEAMRAGYGAIAAIAFAVGAIVFLHHRWNRTLTTAVTAASRQMTQAEGMAALASQDEFSALPWSGWALAPDVIVRCIGYLRVRNWTTVVECGSGLSTVLFAREFRARGKGHVYALEHNAEWAELVRAMLAERGLTDWATVVTAPLEPMESDGRQFRWYAKSAIAPVLALPKVDLLLVDGPPRETSALARYPALPTFFPQLRDSFMVVLDDGYRPDETTIAAMWSERYKTRFTLAETVRGQWEAIS